MKSFKSEIKVKSIEFDLFECPFINKCVLNKIESCRCPEFYNCPEFQSKKQKLFLK